MIIVLYTEIRILSLYVLPLKCYSTKMRYEIKHNERNKTNKHETPQKPLLTFWYLFPDSFLKNQYIVFF